MSLEPIEYVDFVYNASYGGFGFSDAFLEEFEKRHGDEDPELCTRWDPKVVSLVQEMGKKANGDCSKLAFVVVPKELVDYIDISEYDGCESVEINYDLIYRELMKETYDGNSLTDAIKRRYERIQMLEQTAGVKKKSK